MSVKIVRAIAAAAVATGLAWRVADGRVPQAAPRLAAAATSATSPPERDSVADPYSDSRVVAWSRAFLEGHADEVIRATETDLAGASPHPFAAHVWVRTQDSRGRLPAAWRLVEQQSALRRALGELPDVYLRYRRHENEGLLRDYPAAQADRIGSVWALQFLERAADRLDRHAEQYGYLVASLRKDPTFLGAAWDLRALAGNDPRVARQVATLVAAGGALSGTPAGRFLQETFDGHEEGSIASVHFATAWLATRPRDAWMLRLRARRLRSLQRFEAAARDARAEREAYPFDEGDDLEEALVRLGRLAEARQASAAWTRLWTADTTRLSALRESDYVAALRSDGELGEARRVLDRALAQWPGEPRLLAQAAAIELDANRGKIAAELAGRLVRVEPDSIENHVKLIAALTSAGRPEEAVAHADSVGARRGRGSVEYFVKLAAAHHALRRYADAEAVLLAGIAVYPDNRDLHSWRVHVLESAGRHADALAALRQALSVATPDAYLVHKVVTIAAGAGTPQAGTRLLDSLRTAIPWSLHVWKEASDGEKGADRTDRRIALWRAAIAANPRKQWPWDQLTTVLASAERWSEGARAAEEEINALGTAGPDDRAAAINDAAIMLDYHLENGAPLDSATARRGFERAARYDSIGGSRAEYHWMRGMLFEHLGIADSTAREQLLAAQLSPDHKGRAFGVATRHRDAIGIGTALSVLHHYVDRNPFDAERLINGIEIHSRWSGGYIQALRYQRMLEENVPDQARKSVVRFAYEALGDDSARVEEYLTATNVDHSDRYIDWYDAVRHRAQETRSRVVPHLDSGLVEIVHPNGQMERWAEHPISGKRTLLQIGAAWVRAEYDSLGDNLLRITSSGGSEVRLTYDADKRINKMVTSLPGEVHQRTVTFEYDSRGKPTHIAVLGVGDIRVTYKPGGEIDSVRASPPGRAAALVVTSAFQELLNLIRPFERRTGTELPRLPFRDPTLDSLRERYTQARYVGHVGNGTAQRVGLARALLPYARHLVDHVADTPEHATAATHALDELRELAGPPNGPPSLTRYGIQAVVLSHDLLVRTNPSGVGAEGWKLWSEQLDWLAHLEAARGRADPELRSARAHLDARPIGLVPAARWFPRSSLNNPGFWRRYRISELVPASSSETVRPSAVIVRRNGEVVVGSASGISVLRRGYWQWFGFDEARTRWSSTLAPDDTRASSRVLALAEDARGVLWVGTESGLIRVSDDYGAATRWSTVGEGLPSPRVEHLAPFGSNMLVGTPRGLRVVRGERLVPVAAPFTNEPIVVLRAAARPEELLTGPRQAGDSATDADVAEDASRAGDLPLLVGTPARLFAWSTAGAVTALTSSQVDDAIWAPDGDRLLVKRGESVFIVEWDGKSQPRAEIPLPGAQDIVKATTTHAFAWLPIGDDAVGTAILTDQGASVFEAEHVEHIDFPKFLASRQAGVYKVDSRAGRSVFLTSEGVYAFEKGQAMGDNAGAVSDLLTLNELHLTFVARGQQGLFAVHHDAAQRGPQYFDGVNATRLARDWAGRLVTNDGTSIVRYPRGSSSPEPLFDARSTTVPGDSALTTRKIGNILVASDSTIWVAAGSSLFRWKEGANSGQATEFSFFADPERFPAFSEMISRVVETVDHRIWVIASDERHLQYRGQPLRGGVLEWTGTAFRRLGIADSTDAWFITGYTPVDSTTAIVGTSSGFALQRDRRYARFREDLSDTTYKELSARSPLLWLGTRGAKVGTDSWVFGTAGGVVANLAGQWLYPERLNWMLPDDQLSQYGSRTVHAVETDSAGRIYAGTDRGLLIYDAGGGVVGFLAGGDTSATRLVQYAEAVRLRQQANVVLGAIPDSGTLGRTLRAVRQAGAEVEQLRNRLNPGQTLALTPAATDRDGNRGPVRDASAGDRGTAARAHTISTDGELTQLQQELQAKLRAHQALLLQLKRTDPTLYHLVTLDPIDLNALRGNLGERDIVVQYLPADRKLYIQLVTRAGVEMRQVDSLPRDVLQRRALDLATLLSGRAPRASLEGAPIPLAIAEARAVPTGDVVSELAWMYDRLLRPIENRLEGREHVFVVAAGTLNYVPFAALVRSRVPSVEYAAERFTIGYLPSMYMLDLMLRHQPSSATDALVMGDPNGTLRAAREEAGAVNSVLRSSAGALVGAQASFANLQRYAATSRVVHLATHAALDAQRPERSYVLLGESTGKERRLSMEEAMLLPLSQTDLVVLSACQTGLGALGLEHATLAWAFAHAGAPTVVATLWEVNDASSRTLMEEFYRNLRDGYDVFLALARAQRAMLKQSTAAAAPEVWAGYVPFGSPTKILFTP